VHAGFLIGVHRRCPRSSLGICVRGHSSLGFMFEARTLRRFAANDVRLIPRTKSESTVPAIPAGSFLHTNVSVTLGWLNQRAGEDFRRSTSGISSRGHQRPSHLITTRMSQNLTMEVLLSFRRDADRSMCTTTFEHSHRSSLEIEF
jgi:hypothetical protein